jgi:hypothetical protein
MAIADHRKHKLQDKKLFVGIGLITAVLATSGAIAWNKLKQAQENKIQQARVSLQEVCQSDINSTANLLDTTQKVDDATSILRSVPNLPGLDYQQAQNELNNFADCIQVVNANGDFLEAQQLSQRALSVNDSKPFTISEWQGIRSDLEKAIDLLQNIPSNVNISAQAKKELKGYQSQLGTINRRIQAEEAAIKALSQAESLKNEVDSINQLLPNAAVLSQAESKLNNAIQILKNIPEGTTVSAKSQDELSLYQDELRDIQYKIGAIKIQPLIKSFSKFATGVDVNDGYRAYSQQVQDLQEQYNQLLADTPAIKNHSAVKVLNQALTRYNDALVVWRYCQNDNCPNSIYAGIFDIPQVIWLPASFDIKGVPLNQKYGVKETSNIFGRKYVRLNETLNNIWDLAQQDIKEAESKSSI